MISTTFLGFVALGQFSALPRRISILAHLGPALAPPSCGAAASPPEVRLWAYLHVGLPAVRFLVVK